MTLRNYIFANNNLYTKEVLMKQTPDRRRCLRSSLGNQLSNTRLTQSLFLYLLWKRLRTNNYSVYMKTTGVMKQIVLMNTFAWDGNALGRIAFSHFCIRRYIIRWNKKQCKSPDYTPLVCQLSVDVQTWKLNKLLQSCWWTMLQQHCVIIMAEQQCRSWWTAQYLYSGISIVLSG